VAARASTLRRCEHNRSFLAVPLLTGALAAARVSQETSPAFPGRPLALAALIAWLLTASLGGYMLRTWVIRGGLRVQRATGVGVPPAVVFGHAAVALTGLVIWAVYTRTGWQVLAWLGLALIAAAIALGIGTVSLWTPYPIAVPAAAVARPPAAEGGTVTDEMIASLLAHPFPVRRRPRLRLAPLVPVGHGFAALATFMLVMLASVGARLGTFRAQ
jgi:hypothetical protein